MDEVSATDQEDIPETIEKLFRSASYRTLMDLDDGALEPAFQAMALAPNDPEVLCKGASILCRRGRGLQMAEEIYARVLAIDPNYPLALNQLALYLPRMANIRKPLNIQNGSSHYPNTAGHLHFCWQVGRFV